jgi:hypothetical protein
MSDKFIVHGNVSISIDENILVIECTGPWNKEYFHHLHQELLAEVQKIDITNYAILLIPYGEAIATHESLEYHIEFIRQGNTKAVAINLSHCETPNSTRNLCCSVYDATQLTYDFFDSNKQAKTWLRAKLG